MMLRRSILGIAGLAVSMYVPLAAAQVPQAMDRAPADAHVVGAIKNLERFSGQVRNMAQQLRLPDDAISQLQHVNQLLALPGMNASGSAAFVLMPGENEEDDQRMVMILPVSDMQAMVRELGGEPGPGVNQVEIEGNTLYMKNLDGGFVAASEDQDAVEGFQAARGSTQKFQQMLGPSGRSLVERSEVFFVANIPALAPKLREGLRQGMEQAQMMAMMAPGQAPNFEAMEAFANDFINDAQSAVLGMNLGEAGLSLGMAAQFTEGSQMAGYFSAQGNASSILSALPNQPFLMAVALDTSSPGIKKFFQRLTAMNPDQNTPGLGPVQIAKMVEKTDGVGFFWGTTPALMGGLFLNSLIYYRSNDPAALVAQTRETMQQLNKQTVNDITFTTSYTENGEKIGDRSVDVWSMKMQADPTKPGGQQVAQMQMMMFGPAGMGGYMARTDNGLVMTYAKNKALLEQALTSVRQGNQGLTQDQGAQQVAQQLPQGATVAGYVGIRNILELALGFMGMMGGGPQIEVPETLPPIGFGMVTNSGGVHGQLFVPTAVMQTFREMGEAMNAGQEMDFDDEETGQDEF